MGQASNNTESMYDTVAQEYARCFSGEHENKPMDREVLRRFAREIGTSGPVWDLGCGPGQTSKYLKDLGVDICGLDQSEKLLEQARTLHPKIRFQKGDLLQLDFEDCSIAGIVAFYAIVHFPPEQVRTAFHEIFRILKPGGIFLFTFHVGEQTIHLDTFLGKKIDVDFMFFTTDFIRARLAECGLQETQTLERAPYPDVEYQSRRAYVFAQKPGA